jgi:hypothetical protein
VCRRRFLLRDEGRDLSRDCSTHCRPNCHASCDRGAGCRGAPAACSRSGLLGCAASATCRSDSSRECAQARAACWFSAARRESARPPCFGTCRPPRRMPDRPGGGCRVRDGARIRGTACAVRADARASRASDESAARRVEHGVRPERRAAPGSLPRRAGGPEPRRDGRRAPRLQAGVDAAIALLPARACARCRDGRHRSCRCQSRSL